MAQNLKDFACDTCTCVDGRAPGFTEENPRWEIPGVISTSRCLRQLVTPASWEFIRLFRHYKAGVLPLAGGLFDQPARFVDAMEVIDGQSES